MVAFKPGLVFRIRRTTPEKFYIEACDDGSVDVLAIDRVSTEMTLQVSKWTRPLPKVGMLSKNVEENKRLRPFKPLMKSPKKTSARYGEWTALLCLSTLHNLPHSPRSCFCVSAFHLTVTLQPGSLPC